MPINNFASWSTTPGSNTDVGGVNIAEGCAPSGLNDAMRNMMAQLKAGVLSLAGGTIGGLIVSGATGSSRGMAFATNGVLRWNIYESATAEGGANSGSDFGIARYNDAGSVIATSLSISRATGEVSVLEGLIVSGQQKIPTAPTAAWQQAVTSTITIANGASTTFPAGAGLWLVTSQTSNQTALFVCGGGAQKLLGQTGTLFVDNGTATSGKIAMLYNGTNAYVLFNNSGSSQTLGVMLIQTGPTS